MECGNLRVCYEFTCRLNFLLVVFFAVWLEFSSLMLFVIMDPADSVTWRIATLVLTEGP